MKASISNNSGAFGKTQAPDTQDLVDDIVENMPDEGDPGCVPPPMTGWPPPAPSAPERGIGETAMVAAVAILAWEIIKSLFEN